MSPTSSTKSSNLTVKTSVHFDRQRATLAARSGLFSDHLLWMVDRALGQLVNPKVAFHSSRELGNRAYDFRGIHRYKGHLPEWKASARIFYIASSDMNRLVVLEWGERQVGKPTDAYVEFGDRLKSGYYDPYFRLLKLRHAYWQIADAPQALHSSKR